MARVAADDSGVLLCARSGGAPAVAPGGAVSWSPPPPLPPLPAPASDCATLAPPLARRRADAAACSAAAPILPGGSGDARVLLAAL
jgi:hypothetical protein